MNHSRLFEKSVGQTVTLSDIEDLLDEDNTALPELMKSASAVRDYGKGKVCLLYTSPSPRDATLSRMPSSA